MEMDQGVCITYELWMCLFPQGLTEVTGNVTKGQNWLYKFTFSLHKPFEWSRHIPSENARYAGEENNACGSVSSGHRWTVQILQVTWVTLLVTKETRVFLLRFSLHFWLALAEQVKVMGKMIKTKFPTKAKKYWKSCWRGCNLGNCLLIAFASGVHYIQQP